MKGRTAAPRAPTPPRPTPKRPAPKSKEYIEDSDIEILDGPVSSAEVPLAKVPPVTSTSTAPPPVEVPEAGATDDVEMEDVVNAPVDINAFSSEAGSSGNIAPRPASV